MLLSSRAATVLRLQPFRAAYCSSSGTRSTLKTMQHSWPPRCLASTATVSYVRPVGRRTGSVFCCAARLTRTQPLCAAAHARERTVRAKATPAAAAAADANDLLDALYAAEAKDAAQAVAAAEADASHALDALYGADDAPETTAAAAAAEGTPADAVDDILDALYGDTGPAAAAAAAATSKAAPTGQKKQSATVPVVAAPVVAAAAAEDGRGDLEEQQHQLQQRQQQSSSLTSSGGAAAGGSTSGRVPPTHIEVPDLPSDLSVFNNAVLLVDKPKEWTSFDACNAIKGAMRKLGVKKVGHAGTLDPAATGLLIICTGSGTKAIEGFMAAHKEYSGTLKLGEGTASLDAETEVEERLPWEHITDEQIVEAAKKLTGDIEQVPPMYSALHHQGQRLHELARAGVTVERAARPVTITRFDVHRDPQDPQLVHFYVGCTKGTYIRTLGHDLATSLGTTGHLVALRREAIGDARVDKAWDVKMLVDKIYASMREQGIATGSSGGGGGGKRQRGGGKGRGGSKKQQGEEQQQQQPQTA